MANLPAQKYRESGGKHAVMGKLKGWVSLLKNYTEITTEKILQQYR